MQTKACPSVHFNQKVYCPQFYIYYATKFSNFFNPNFFHDQICAFFIGRVLQKFTFHDNFARFSDVHGLPRDVEEIMQI